MFRQADTSDLRIIPMQHYYVTSIDALKKRVKQFHSELKKHSNDVHLSWCRDFTAKLLLWDSWNELHQAHQKPFTHEMHQNKIFDRDFVSYKAQIERFQKETISKLTEQRPSLTPEEVALCAKTLWRVPHSGLLLDEGKSIALEYIPEDCWRDNTYVKADREDAYEDFVLRALTPVIAKNGGIIMCDESSFGKYYQKLSSLTSVFHVLDLSLSGNDILQGAEYKNAHPVKLTLNLGANFWEDYMDAWDAAILAQGVNADYINTLHVAELISVYFKVLLKDSELSEAKICETMKDEGDFKSLQGLLTRDDLSDNERTSLAELAQIVSVRSKGTTYLGTELSNASQTVMGFIDPRSNNEKRITVDELRTSHIPLLMIKPKRGLAGVVNLLCKKISEYGSHVSPNGNKYDGKPTRLWVLPYNGQYTPRGLAVSSLTTRQAGWGYVSGGGGESAHLNREPHITCFTTYVANVGNYITVKERKLFGYFKTGHQFLWQTKRYPPSREVYTANITGHPLEHYPVITLEN